MISVMVSVNPEKYIVTKERISETPFYPGELDRIVTYSSDLFKEKWCSGGGKEEVFYNHGHIVLIKEFDDFLSEYEEKQLRSYFESCVEKAVRLMVEETFFDER